LKKSTVIATCLVKSNMFRRIEDAESAVRNVFLDQFPTADFDSWNGEIGDEVADGMIKAVGRASRINVKKFIEDLWQ